MKSRIPSSPNDHVLDKVEVEAHSESRRWRLRRFTVAVAVAATTAAVIVFAQAFPSWPWFLLINTDYGILMAVAAEGSTASDAGREQASRFMIT